MAYSYITKKKLKQQKMVEKVLAMIAKENNWKVKHIIQNGNRQHIIYEIPHD